MKLAVSNIAWPAELDAVVFEFLVAGGIDAIEVAPTRVWPHWQGIDAASVRAFRRVVESSGLGISSLQSILFQKPELNLFGSDEDRRAMKEHLRQCADLAANLGAGCMVFGAPRNRDRGSLPEAEAFAIATDFFARVGADCAQRGVYVGFEANPVEYKCNFATESGTAARLVRAVDSEGFRLHLDTACLHLSGENAVRAIRDNADILRHFHASEPYLAGFSAPASAHAEAAAALRSVAYDRWIALEMRTADPPLPSLEEAVRFVRGIYGDTH
jgi:D-psicose/D-tagatose/L-ribulose 3-epimerase